MTPVQMTLVVEETDPIAGRVVVEGRRPRRFQGWLGLLRVLSDLLQADDG